MGESGPISGRLKRVKRTASLLWKGVRAIVSVAWNSSREPTEQRCQECGYEGTADRSIGIKGAQTGLEEINGEMVPMWAITESEGTYCTPCFHERNDVEAVKSRPADMMDRLRHLQVAKYE